MEECKLTLNGLNQSIDASIITFEHGAFSANSFLKIKINKGIYEFMLC